MKTLSYIFVLFLFVAFHSIADKKSSIGYSTVAEALKTLKNDPKANIEKLNGWTIISTMENTNLVSWSFTPATHPAHPAAIKRIIVKNNGSIYIQMQALCQASKTECDKLVNQFKALNLKIKEYIKKMKSGS